MDNHTIIDIQDMTVCQGVTALLTNICFTIYKNEFVFLIGKTGSGKSSLIKTLYGELACKATKAQLGAFDLTTILPAQLPFLRRQLGIIFQDFQLLMDRNVKENLSFVLRATGWKNRQEIQNRLTTVLNKVGLETSFHKMPYQLSGGEQQRVAIARALLNQPLLLLADEPTGNLDPEIAYDILNLFFEINQAGTAVLMATHNYDFLHKNPTIRVLKCSQGKLIQDEPTPYKN